MPTLEDFQKAFPGQEIIKTYAGIIIKTRGGKAVLIRGVDYIDVDSFQLKIGYNKEQLSKKDVLGEEEKAVGRYKNGVIDLVRGEADKITLSHESVHWMEDIGVLNSIDVAALRGHIKRLIRKKEFSTVNKEDMGGSEDRAKFLAEALNAEEAPKGFVGRIVSRIQDFIDKIVNLFGLRTVKGIVRDIKSGEIFNNAIETKPQGKQQYAIGQKLRESEVPVDDVAPKELNTKGTNSEIISRAAEEYRSWPEKITAADGSEILLANPEDGYISKRALHLVWDNEKDAIHLDKAKWLPNVPETLRNAAARVVDQQSGNRIYVRAYNNNEKHMVVVAPDGNVIEQESFKGKLITQFPYIKPGKQGNMIIDWERNGIGNLQESSNPSHTVSADLGPERRVKGLGRSQENPNPTSPASTIPGSQQGTFQDNNTLSGEEVKGEEQYSIRSNINIIPEETNGMLKEKWDEFLYQVQDRFRYLSKEQQRVVRERGEELSEEEDAYLAETRYHGMAAAAIDEFEENHVDPILKLMEQGELSIEEVGQYLHARHAPEANERLRSINPTAAELDGVIQRAKDQLEMIKAERVSIRKSNPGKYPVNKRYRQTEKELAALHAEISRLENYDPIDDNTALSGMSDEEATSIIHEIESGSKSQYYRKIGELVDGMTKTRRELLIEAGLETPETIDKWESLYEHYVPLMREGKGAAMPRKGRGYEVKGGQKLRAGSKVDVVNILANLVAQHEATIIRAEKAKVGRAFLEFAKNNKGPWKIDKPEQVAVYTADGLITYKDNPMGYALADNVFSIRVDGEDHHITFDENNEHAMKICSSLKNLDGGDTGAFIRILSKISRYLAMVNTSLNPEFIISNFARDIQTAAYNMSDSEADKIRMKAIKQVGSAFKGIWQYERNVNRESEWAQWFDRFRHAGGQTGWIQSYEDINEREKDLIRKIKHMQPGKIRLVRRGLEAAFDFIADTNTAVENAIRLSVFKNLVEANVSEAKAAKISKELTVNFNRRGNLGPFLNAAYLFFNASMQGSARIIMAAAKSRKVRKLMAATVGFALMLDIANRLIGGDGDDGEPLYDKIGNWEKERNLIIMLGSGNGYAKIPLPWGYNVFHVLGQAAGEVLTKKHNKIIDSTLRVVGAAISAFNPMGGEASLLQVLSPTITDPFVQWAENKDWTGRKLRPSANVFAEKPSSQTYWKSVREPSRWIAEKLNSLTGGDEIRPGKMDYSPEAFDLAIDTFTGGTGKFVSNLISTPVKLATGDTVETFEVPFLRKVYGKPGKQVLTQEFYENIDEVRLVSRQLNHYKDNPEKVREIIKEYRPEVRLIKRMEVTQDALKQIREARQEIEKKTKNEEIKERKLKALDESADKIMMNFNKHYHRMMEKGSKK